MSTSEPRARHRAGSGSRRPTASTYGAHYGTVAPRDELSLTYSARRRATARRRDRRIALVATLLVLLLAAVLAFLACSRRDHMAPAGDAGSVIDTPAATGTDVPADVPASTTPLEEGRIVMTLGGDVDTYVRRGETYLEAGCHAFDRVEGDLTQDVTVSGSVDGSTVGDYVVTYTVRNAAGMVASAQRTVHVVADDAMEWDTNGVPVLMYHYVYDPSDPPESLDVNYISTTDLEAQLQWLTENDWYYPSWQELRAYVDGTHSLPAKSVILSFDDGEYGFLDHGIPLLERYQVPATSFVECSRDDIQRVIVDYASEYISFQSHSYAMHHAGSTQLGHGGRIYDLSEDELVSDLQQAADILGTNEAFAYPFGDVSDVSPAAMDRVGILCAVTTNYGNVLPGADHARLPRVRVSGGNSLSSWVSSVEN